MQSLRLFKYPLAPCLLVIIMVMIMIIYHYLYRFVWSTKNSCYKPRTCIQQEVVKTINYNMRFLTNSNKIKKISV